MKILIDGYNLLHASGIFGGVRGARGFEASRQALLDELARLLGAAAGGVTVVFDAADAPPGLPDRSIHEGISVRFARGYESADALIEELIDEHTAPTGLTVVSADNRVIAAARRRRAKPAASGESVATGPLFIMFISFPLSSVVWIGPLIGLRHVGRTGWRCVIR